MNLVVSDGEGRDLFQTSEFDLSLQYGEANDFQLSISRQLEGGWRFHIDGTPFAGVIDKVCPTRTSSGDSMSYKGRTLQGVLASHIVEPPAGESHYSFAGDANGLIAAVLAKVGLDDGWMSADAAPCGKDVRCTFNRYVDAYTGLRMALSSIGMRLEVACQQGGHVLRAADRASYGRIDSERVHFSLERDVVPVNKLIGLGKGEGAERAVSVWYADAAGEVSQTQTLFGTLENAQVYSLNAEEADSLPGKVRAKLLEYQEASAARVTLPDGARLDVDDVVAISSARFGVEATTKVTDVVLKAKGGVASVGYEFGAPSFPDEEED